MIKKVVLSKRAEKDLMIVPSHIAIKLLRWSEMVEVEGLESARSIKGFHDEPLKGKRQGERSIRLSLAYRAIYRIIYSENNFVLIEEVNKHVY